MKKKMIFAIQSILRILQLRSSFLTRYFNIPAPASILPGGANNSSAGSSIGGSGAGSSGGSNNAGSVVSAAAAAGVVVPGPTGQLMNNGSRDMSSADLQKLQQQLHDIKEQVRNILDM